MESRFTLGLNMAKNINYIKKHFKQKLLRNKFPTKKSVAVRVYLPQKLS